MQDFSLATAHLGALFASDQPCNFRAIHDRDKAKPAIKRRGTIAQHWAELCDWNNKGYGVFVTVAAMDGSGYDQNGQPIRDENGRTSQGDLMANVAAIRAHYVDLDQISAPQDIQAASAHFPQPQFYVNSSPNKFHVYWVLSQQYRDNPWFDQQQRKLAQLFRGDPRVVDPTRVMRLAGFYHHKGEPHLVTCGTLPGWGALVDPAALAASVAHVNVVQHGGGVRKPLGDPDLAAPGMDWVQQAFALSDPNQMDRDEWISFTAAIKQAMWSWVEPDEAFRLWSEWCERYAENDPGENSKQWNDLTETQVGWSAIERKIPTIHAARKLGRDRPPVASQPLLQSGDAVTSAPVMAMPAGDNAPRDPAAPVTFAGDILAPEDQAFWFEGCSYVSSLGKIYDKKSNRFFGSGDFTSKFGGKLFVLDDFGKTTDEAWKAATRGRIFSVPKLDHIRFLPHEEFGKVIVDELGREGINIYQTPRIKRMQGDASLFLRHMELLLPDADDRHKLFSYMAHNAQFPGHKIAWAPFIQSAEGVGKGVLKLVMQHVVGASYFYSPKAKELAESGAKFNAWMRAKLFILVDEIKVDERRDLMETLKPMISEEQIEVQAKGVDQQQEDNFANWMFFSNWQNSFPITRNSRRIAPFFSPIQSARDIELAGMGEEYFNTLYGWLKDGPGAAIVYDWLMNYPIECGQIPKRAPWTTSTETAIQKSRGGAERIIAEAIEDDLPGFKGGWFSSLAVEILLKERGLRTVSKIALDEMANNLGYHEIGRSPRAFFQEGKNKPYLYALDYNADPQWYGQMQGYGA